MLPSIVAFAALMGLGEIFLLAPAVGPWAGIVGLAIFVIAVVAVTRLPREALFWGKGARGERRSAEILDALGSRGFVILYNRLMPDGRGDIDSIAIGPTPGSLLKFFKTRRLAGARCRTSGEHEIGDPDMTLQILAAASGTRLIGQSKFRRSEQDGWRSRFWTRVAFR